MKPLSVSFFFYFFLFLLTLFREVKAVDQQAQNNGVYIVYMGAATSRNGTLRDDHNQLLTSLSKRKGNALVHTYKKGFSGFAARLTKEAADSIAKRPGVVSVFPDPILKLHTTRSWDFLKYQTDLEINSNPPLDSEWLSQGSESSDTIIGILDSGIWPESPSFSDKGMGPIPSRWRGTCMEGEDFNSSHCNRKLIGARYYNDPEEKARSNGTPRDMVGHGTHVASTAAGNPIPGASFYGLAAGTAKGGSPGSRIAVYQVCTSRGCLGSAILAAFDDAIADGVDVLSLSLGTSAEMAPEFSSDPIAIGSFHAVDKGITVVCSGGNDGPETASVVNVAPWILTVAATTIDRDVESNVVLGNNKVIKGGGIHFADLERTPVYPLVYGWAALSGSEETADEYDASNCNVDSLDADKVRGKIVVCENEDDQYTPLEKLEGVRSLGGIGIVLIDDHARFVSSSFKYSAISIITRKDATEIISPYVNSTWSPTATILQTVSITKYKPAPTVAYFSSRGPARGTGNLIKPDIAAPGVNILAAWPANDTTVALNGRDPPLFYMLSGTSMSCPHVAGIAATVKSRFPTWTPSAIKSAIMTTATQTNNLKGPITYETETVATPYDYGAGEVTTTGPLQPGLVYETSTMDYLQFLCNKGYDASAIKNISTAIPDAFTCPENRNADLISDLNYPTIAVSGFNESKIVSRIVSNVGADEETVYSLTINAPAGLYVGVLPEKLRFTKTIKKLTYGVIFRSTVSSLKKDVFGSITWTNGKYKVRTPFIVSSQ